MGKKNKSTLVKSVEWAKHLRPFNKKRQNSKERKMAKKVIKKELDN